MRQGDHGEKALTATGFGRQEKPDEATAKQKGEQIEALLRSGAQLLGLDDTETQKHKSIEEILAHDSETRTFGADEAAAPEGGGGGGGQQQAAPAPPPRRLAAASRAGRPRGGAADLDDPSPAGEVATPTVPAVAAAADLAVPSTARRRRWRSALEEGGGGARLEKTAPKDFEKTRPVLAERRRPRLVLEGAASLRPAAAGARCAVGEPRAPPKLAQAARRRRAAAQRGGGRRGERLLLATTTARAGGGPTAGRGDRRGRAAKLAAARARPTRLSWLAAAARRARCDWAAAPAAQRGGAPDRRSEARKAAARGEGAARAHNGEKEAVARRRGGTAAAAAAARRARRRGRATLEWSHTRGKRRRPSTTIASTRRRRRSNGGASSARAAAALCRAKGERARVAVGGAQGGRVRRRRRQRGGGRRAAAAAATADGEPPLSRAARPPTWAARVAERAGPAGAHRRRAARSTTRWRATRGSARGSRRPRSPTARSTPRATARCSRRRRHGVGEVDGGDARRDGALALAPAERWRRGRRARPATARTTTRRRRRRRARASTSSSASLERRRAAARRQARVPRQVGAGGDETLWSVWRGARRRLRPVRRLGEGAEAAADGSRRRGALRSRGSREAAARGEILRSENSPRRRSRACSSPARRYASRSPQPLLADPLVLPADRARVPSHSPSTRSTPRRPSSPVGPQCKSTRPRRGGRGGDQEGVPAVVRRTRAQGRRRRGAQTLKLALTGCDDRAIAASIVPLSSSWGVDARKLAIWEAVLALRRPRARATARPEAADVDLRRPWRSLWRSRRSCTARRRRPGSPGFYEVKKVVALGVDEGGARRRTRMTRRTNRASTTS